MPKTTIYIRNDDWDKWRLTENKSELISRALNEPSGGPKEPKVAEPKLAEPKGSVSSKRHKSILRSDEDNIEFCQHDSVKGFCKRGCR